MPDREDGFEVKSVGNGPTRFSVSGQGPKPCWLVKSSNFIHFLERSGCLSCAATANKVRLEASFCSSTDLPIKVKRGVGVDEVSFSRIASSILL